MDKKRTGICVGLLLMLLFWAASPCFSGQADQDVKVVYSDLHFLVPGGMTAIGTTKGSLFFRYQKGFLAFSEVDDYRKSKQECSFADLVRFLIPHSGSSAVREKCGKDARRFKKMMLADAQEHGIWEGEDLSAYFIIAGDASPSQVFLFSGKKLIKIDSDFMDGSSFRHVLSRYIIEANDEDEAFPPGDLIAANIQSTDMTVAVEITGVKQERVIRADDGRAGYVAFRMTARTLIVYKGKINPGDSISYGVLLEAGIKPPKKGTKQIVSLRKKAEGFILPGGGYGFEYSKKLDSIYKRAAKTGKD